MSSHPPAGGHPGRRLILDRHLSKVSIVQVHAKSAKEILAAPPERQWRSIVKVCRLRGVPLCRFRCEGPHPVAIAVHTSTVAVAAANVAELLSVGQVCIGIGANGWCKIEL